MSSSSASAAAASKSLCRLLQIFPSKPSFAFAYGSCVKQQLQFAGATIDQQMMIEKHAVGDEDGMLDLILAVDDVNDFHRQNLQSNPSHYSFMKFLGPSIISRYQQSFGARVYFNTLVNVERVMEEIEDGIVDDNNSNHHQHHAKKINYTKPKIKLIKYGIIGTQNLINDLLDWNDLYIAGRLHKPVTILSPADSAPLRMAINLNLKSAVHASLLMLSETFSESLLYKTIANLSYAGDVRMILGENRNKVANIVDAQVEEFRKLYHPILLNQSMDKMISWNPSTGTFVQDLHPAVILHHLNLIPKELQTRLYLRWNHSNSRGSASSADLEDVLQHLSKSYAISDKVKHSVDSIVRSSSIRQTLMGIPMAGINKSIRYARRKVGKMIRGWREGKRF